jgi:hypothetical protein
MRYSAIRERSWEAGATASESNLFIKHKKGENYADRKIG